MIRLRRFMAAGAAGAVVVLFVAACGGSGGERSDSSEPMGDPVLGGNGRVLMTSEPRSLDPAAIGNAAISSGVLGNALFGTLMINDPVTGELEYQMADSFTSSDGGATFELKIKQGLVFTDGTPLDSEAVKFNWDRLADPATASVSIRDAAMVSATEVVDPLTLKVVLRAPIPKYGNSVVASGMNWIASPNALQEGQQAFDQNPVGAGPFVLKSWTRQAKIDMVRNPTYWDAPKPYLDSVTFRTVPDTMQRKNTLVSGEADVAIVTDPLSVAEMREAGMSVDVVAQGGGQALFMNMRRAPFDDLRARQAVSAALNLDAINEAAFEGKADVPRTLFQESSPFFEDVALLDYDPALAQKLFDELAAEGKPVKFVYTAYNTTEYRSVAEAVQAALSAYKNVDVEVRVIDVAEIPTLFASNDYDMLISSAQLIDPEPQMWTVFHGDSTANRSGLDDPQLNAALDRGRLNQVPEERKQDYDEAQRRLVELTPAIFYARSSATAAAAENVHGVVHYGFASLLPEEIWIQ